jgi:maltooligosyltrehalose trehalohydrolase
VSATSAALAPDSAGALPWQEPLGATPCREGTEFRVWAPRARSVSVVWRGGSAPLGDRGLGVHAGRASVGAGTDYRYVLEPAAGGRPRRLPDPCSRSQPGGLRGPSRVLDPDAFAWTDADFEPPPLRDLVIYELHVGTFTAPGTFAAAAERLGELRELGITAVELMPIADFPGIRGWGYDGVYISAAHRAYGGPEGFAQFVDRAHANGIAVLLDVVYNHVGASGVRAIEAFGPYFTDRYETAWGKAINYDDADCDPVREWVLQSASGWVRDFHVDGLRLDAIHAIYDASAHHIVAELAARIHALRPRALVIAESGLNDPRVIRPVALGGFGCNAQWADDFHHALWALLTGERDGYYADFGSVAHLAKAFRRPFVYDGGYSRFRKRCFGAPADDRPIEQFIVFAQNHDQVGNRAYGDRLPPRAHRLAAFCTLLSPFAPLLFMGEEYGETAPFQFFTDHIDKRIATATREGRRREFEAFRSFAEEIPDPQEEATFERSKLTRKLDQQLLALYRELLRARRLLRGDARAIEFDERARWLRVDRDGGELVCNFAEHTQELTCAGRDLVCATDRCELRDGALLLPGFAGALVR